MSDGLKVDLMVCALIGLLAGFALGLSLPHAATAALIGVAIRVMIATLRK